ncbi:MAG: hypothetical protein ACRC37_08210, partial [Lentisphaeria bacterium]
MKGKFVGIFVILLGAALGVFFCGNSSGKIAKNSDSLEFGENPGKNFGENGFFEGKTTELFPKNAKTARFANLVSAKSGRFDDEVAAKIAVILDKDLSGKERIAALRELRADKRFTLGGENLLDLF